MKRKELKAHIQLKWKYYLLGILASFIVSILAVNIASAPTKKEKVAVFLTCYNTSSSFNEYIESITPDYLEIIELNIKHKEDDYYGTVIKGYRKAADILIIPESKIEYLFMKNCLVLTDECISELTNRDYEYYSVDGKNYGIKVYSKDTDSGILEGLVDFNKEGSEEDCYLFINNKSLHLGKYNNSKYDGAISILKEILNYEAQSSE